MHGIALRAPFEVERKGRQHDPGLPVKGCSHLTVSEGLPAPSQEGHIALPLAGEAMPSTSPHQAKRYRTGIASLNTVRIHARFSSEAASQPQVPAEHVRSNTVRVAGCFGS